SFPNFKGSSWDKEGYKTMRNATTTTIAPTGTISIIAQTTSGIEPLFAISFVRDVMEGTKLLETNGLFERIARERGFYSQELMMEIATTGSVKKNDKIPEDVQRLFATALDIDPEWHVRMQAAFQKYTDNAVSKTINLRPEATPEDIRKAYLLAYKLKCKGITVFRYGSKREQVLYISPELVREAEQEIEYATAESEYAGGCPFFYCPY
ncbi:MAG: ribonucleotide reductase, partial [Actinomycetota bacterium]